MPNIAVSNPSGNGGSSAVAVDEVLRRTRIARRSGRAVLRRRRNAEVAKHHRPLLTLGLECQRDTVHAVPLTGRPRTIGEHVTQMATAVRAMDFGPRHEMAAILGGIDRAVSGAQKLGQPVPLSNLVSAANKGGRNQRNECRRRASRVEWARCRRARCHDRGAPEIAPA